MTWGMILKLYAGKEEKSIEIAKCKIKNSERLEKIVARFLEGQKEQMEMKKEGREGRKEKKKAMWYYHSYIPPLFRNFSLSQPTSAKASKGLTSKIERLYSMKPLEF